MHLRDLCAFSFRFCTFCALFPKKNAHFLAFFFRGQASTPQQQRHSPNRCLSCCHLHQELLMEWMVPRAEFQWRGPNPPGKSNSFFSGPGPSSMNFLSTHPKGNWTAFAGGGGGSQKSTLIRKRNGLHRSNPGSKSRFCFIFQLWVTIFNCSFCLLRPPLGLVSAG